MLPVDLEVVPPREIEFDCPSIAEVSVSEGGVSVWCSAEETVCDSPEKVRLQLHPDRPLIIGRSEGVQPEYLDLAYRPTQIGPSGVPVVDSPMNPNDIGVSRAHFMLRGLARGILLVNGVPKRGGGIRPPVNGTFLHHPEHRFLRPGEEVLIERGERILISLPNSALVVISAA